MTAKSHWLNKIYHDSQGLFQHSQGKISWESSDSDTEDMKKLYRKQRRNRGCEDFKSPWLKSTFTITTCGNFVLSTIDTKLNPSTSNLNDFVESPVINRLELREMSPVLTQTSKKFNSPHQISPVIGKQCRLSKIKSKYRNVSRIKQRVLSSPDIFQSQPTQSIHYDSPEKNTETESSLAIEPFPSQNSSLIANCDSSSTSFQTDSDSLYHQPRRKRKRYKKGGIALLLQKILDQQRTRHAIWQHELYTKKIDLSVNLWNDKIVIFIVKSIWTEYGIRIMECELLDSVSGKTDSASNISYLRNLENKNETIIIILGPILNIIINAGGRYKLYPPYSKQTITYKSLEVQCYVNVTRIILCND